MIVRFRLFIVLALLALPASWGLAQDNAAAQVVVQGSPRVDDGQVELSFSVSDLAGLAPAELTAETLFKKTSE